MIFPYFYYYLAAGSKKREGLRGGRARRRSTSARPRSADESRRALPGPAPRAPGRPRLAGRRRWRDSCSNGSRSRSITLVLLVSIIVVRRRAAAARERRTQRARRLRDAGIGRQLNHQLGVDRPALHPVRRLDLEVRPGQPRNVARVQGPGLDLLGPALAELAQARARSRSSSSSRSASSAACRGAAPRTHRRPRDHAHRALARPRSPSSSRRSS